MLAGVTITAAADAKSAAVTTTRFYRTTMSDFTDVSTNKHVHVIHFSSWLWLIINLSFLLLQFP